LNPLVVSFDRSSLRFLRAPAQAVEKTGDMAGVIVDAEAMRNDFCDPTAGPQITRVACGLGSGQENLLQPLAVLPRKLRRPTRSRLGLQRPTPSSPVSCLPTSNAATIDSHPLGHLYWRQALIEQRHRSLAAPLELLRASLRSHVPPPARRLGH